MGKCPACDKEMKTADGCREDRRIVRNGLKSNKPISYGEEPGFEDPETGEMLYWDADNCPDCGVTYGEGNFHHPGCDIERCPFCEGQYLSCSCRTNEDEYRLVGIE